RSGIADAGHSGWSRPQHTNRTLFPILPRGLASVFTHSTPSTMRPAFLSTPRTSRPCSDGRLTVSGAYRANSTFFSSTYELLLTNSLQTTRIGCPLYRGLVGREGRRAWASAVH